GGNITTEHLSVQGNGYGSIYAFSSGNLTINGSSDLQGAVSISTNHVPAGEDAFSFACLTAEEDATINGDVTVEAHGKIESVAGIWIGAGTNTQQGGTPGTVTVNGNLLADASVPPGSSGLVKSDATIRIYASTITLNGNKDPEAKAKGGSLKYQGSITGFNDSDDAVYDEVNPDLPNPDPIYDELISGLRAMIDIDSDKDGTCLNCGNVIILPIARDDDWEQSKNISVIIEVLLDNGYGPDVDPERGDLS
ncbi:MAG: hypothetical protein GTO60_08220, partial [Gammaproteobacteria bacterium]|nr:hypothetical protein [Gammaproteobacteria bacterium]